MADLDPSTEIAIARPTDALTLAEMSRDLVESGLGWSWKPSRILAMIRHPDAVVLVARTRIETAGFAIMEFHDEHAHLNLLAVKPRHRRGGVARALLEWLEESARVAGIASINLEVRSRNTEAKDFYASMGYRIDATLKGYYRGREDAVRMVHDLIQPDIAARRPE